MIPDICTMYILLAAATTFEIQPAIDFLAQSSSPHAGHAAGIAGHATEVLITGIGPVATTWSLMRQIGRQRPDLIIQAGIAGCFTRRALQPNAGSEPGPAHAPGNSPDRPDYQLGEVLAVKEDSLADLGVWEDQRFKTLFDLQLAGKDTPPFSDGLLTNPYKKLLALSGLEQVSAITVSEITTDRVRIGWYQQNIFPIVESMEGAALHYVCLQEDIAFLQLRAVSNDIGERDKTKWDIRTALRQLNDRLIGLLQQLAEHDTDIIKK